MRGEFWPQRITGCRNNADATPVGIDNLHGVADTALRSQIASWAHHLWIAIVEKAALFHHLAQHRIKRGDKALSSEAANGRRNAVLFRNELPFLRPITVET